MEIRSRVVFYGLINDCNVQPLDLQGGESIGLITTVSYMTYVSSFRVAESMSSTKSNLSYVTLFYYTYYYKGALTSASPNFCSAAPDTTTTVAPPTNPELTCSVVSPTISPKTNEPTLLPSSSPQQKPTIPPSTTEPTRQPSILVTSRPTSVPSISKAGKGSKSKSEKVTKSSKTDNSHSMKTKYMGENV